MITLWQISNFKAIREPVSLSLAPLTIFSGPNSSGKSTVIQSILMVAQSLGSSAWEEPLVLNGRFVHLGHLEDVLHYGCTRREIELGFVVEQTGGDQLTVNAIIESHGAQDQGTPSRLRARIKQCIAELKGKNNNLDRMELVRRRPVEVQAGELERANPTIQGHIGRGIFNYDIVSPKPTELARGQILEEVLSASLSNFLPGRMLMRVRPGIRNLTAEIEHLTDAIRTLVDRPEVPRTPIDWDHTLSEAAQRMFELVGQRLPAGGPSGGTDHYPDTRRRQSSFRRPPPSGGTDRYLDTLHEIAGSRSPLTVLQCTTLIKRDLSRGQIADLSRRLIGSLPEMQRLLAADARARERTELEVRQFPAQYSQITDRIQRILGNRVYYLGPLRDDPRVIYAIPSLPNQRDVGLKGEYTAAMLDLDRDRKIAYPLPPGEFAGRYICTQGPLAEAVQTWLQRMGLAETVGTSETPKVGYGLTVRTAGLEKQLDLTSIGVGVSQVLPILVLTLLAPANAILIFEQPEVHLHPKVQSVLGDFFLGIAACGKQCIVETHSEHLINRVRRRVAESPDTQLLKQLRIYFVELEDAMSHFRSVEPNEYGAILEWPKGFFDEVEESSAILRASMEKRRARQTTQNR